MIALITVIVQLVFLESILSLDNAAVLGAMVMRLPSDKPVPWPRVLRWLGRMLERPLGPQRSAALKVGLLGAYAGRALMVGLATFIIRYRWLRLAGAIYLLYLALDYLGKLRYAHAEDEAEHLRLSAQSGFWSIVVMLELADIAFSLDNVVAGVALSKIYWVVLLGVVIGTVMMRFAASIFSRLIEWEPALQHAAYLLILAIGVEQVIDDLFGIHLGEWIQFGISMTILVLTVAFARIRWLQGFNVLWPPLLATCGIVLVPLQWLLWPFRRLLQLVASRRTDAVVPPRS